MTAESYARNYEVALSDSSSVKNGETKQLEKLCGRSMQCYYQMTLVQRLEPI